MRNKNLLIILMVLFSLIITLQVNAQISFQVGAGLGYSTPTGEYGGSTTDFYNGTKYGMSSGFDYHAKVRAGLLFLNAFGEIGFTNFSGEGDAIPGQGNIDISNSVFSLKLGPEFPINIPLSPVQPYLAGFLSVNTISGNVQFQGVQSVPSGKYDISAGTRVGIGGGAGAVFSLGMFKLDFSIFYHLINMTGREFKIENPTSHDRLDSYTSVNDGKDPQYSPGDDVHFISEDRGIGAMEFKLTAMFGI